MPSSAGVETGVAGCPTTAPVLAIANEPPTSAAVVFSVPRRMMRGNPMDPRLLSSMPDFSQCALVSF